MDRWRAWRDGLSIWQFVALAAGCSILVAVVTSCINRLATGHFNLEQSIFYGVMFAVFSLGTWALKRWS